MMHGFSLAARRTNNAVLPDDHSGSGKCSHASVETGKRVELVVARANGPGNVN
jgi:hypothetical protein